MKNFDDSNNDQDQHNVFVPMTEVDTDVKDLFEDLEEKNNIADEQFYESNDCTYDSLFLNKSSFERPESLANNDFLLKDLNQDQKDKIEQIKKLQSPFISNSVNPIAVTEAMPAMSSSKRHFVEPNVMDAEVVETLEPVEAIEAVDASEAIEVAEAVEAVDAVEAVEAVENIPDVSSINEISSKEVDKILRNSNDIKTQKFVSTSNESEKQQSESKHETATKSKIMPKFKEIGSFRRDKTIDSPAQKRDNQNNFSTKSSSNSQAYKATSNFTKSSDSISTQIMKNNIQSSSENKIESDSNSNANFINSSIGTIKQTKPKLIIPIAIIVLAIFLMILALCSNHYTPQGIYVKTQHPLQQELEPMLLAEGIVLGEERIVYAPHRGEIKFNVNPGSQVTKNQKVAILTNLDWGNQLQQNKAELMALLEEWQKKFLELRSLSKNKKTTSFDNITEKFKNFQNKCWEQINTENFDINQELDAWKKTLSSINESKLYTLYYQQNILLQKINDCIKKCQSCKRYTDIFAPYDGIIQKFSYTKQVKSNASLFTIVESSPKYVRIKVRKEYYSILLPIMADKQTFEVRIGVTANMTTNGSISNISLRSDHTKETQCEVIVQLEAAQKIPNGSIAFIQLKLHSKENCLQLPKSAIIHGEDCDHLFYSVLVVDKDNKIERREVTLGLSNANNVEIITGLSDDEFVVTEANIPLSQIPNKSLVRIKK